VDRSRHVRDRTPRPVFLGNKKGHPAEKSPNPPLEELKGGDPPNRSGISEPVGDGKKETAETRKSDGPTATEWSQGPGCASYPKDASIVIVVKTGATEAFSKLPTILLTYLSCVPPSNLLLFSDLAGSIGPFAIHDSLDKVIVDSTKENPDFDLYNQQKALKEVGQTVAMLKSEGRDQAAWNLDKYKNIHTAQKSWDLAPGRDWYLFIDADTYISWANLFLWLARLDAKEKLYLGSQVDAGTQPFAHGGSGYLLSKPAMELLVAEDRKKVAAEYDREAATACCGDQELARSLAKQGLNVTNARPIINGEKVSRFGFGPGMWCVPVVTMHHMMSEEVQDLWAFESKRSEATVSILSPSISMWARSNADPDRRRCSSRKSTTRCWRHRSCLAARTGTISPTTNRRRPRTLPPPHKSWKASWPTTRRNPSPRAARLARRRKPASSSAITTRRARWRARGVSGAHDTRGWRKGERSSTGAGGWSRGYRAGLRGIVRARNSRGPRIPRSVSGVSGFYFAM